jgi:hypothetical protein
VNLINGSKYCSLCSYKSVHSKLVIFLSNAIYLYISFHLKIIHIEVISVIARNTKLRSLSQRANYTDRATAALSAKLVQTSEDIGCHVVSLTDPWAVYSVL